MDPDSDQRNSLSSEGSPYKTARDELTDFSSTLMVDSSADYTFVSNTADVSLGNSSLDSLPLSSSSQLDGSNTLNASVSGDDAVILMVSDDTDDNDNTLDDDDKHGVSDTDTLKSVPSAAAGTSSAQGMPAAAEERVRKVNGELIVKLYDTREEFEKHLPDTVSVLEGPFGCRAYLIGTVHFSEESMNDVSFVIRNVRPDIVMVELCSSRLHILQHDEETLLREAKNLTPSNVLNIFQTNGASGLFYYLMLNMSAKLTKQLGCAPGGEFRRAHAEAQRLNHCKLFLGDRPVNITLQRALQGLSIWETVRVIVRMIFSDDTISAEEVEKCKKRSVLEQMMEELADEFPVFDDVLVKERDLYMAYSLQNATVPMCDAEGRPQPTTVVGVVGIGHAAGIRKHWGKVDERHVNTLMTIPPTSLSKRMLKATIKYGFLGLVCYGLYRVVRPRLPMRLALR